MMLPCLLWVERHSDDRDDQRYRQHCQPYSGAALCNSQTNSMECCCC